MVKPVPGISNFNSQLSGSIVINSITLIEGSMATSQLQNINPKKINMKCNLLQCPRSYQLQVGLFLYQTSSILHSIG